LALPTFSKISPSQNVLFTADAQGYFPLHYAAAAGHEELVSLLVDIVNFAKAKHLLECRDHQGKTPLHWGVLKANGQLVKVLVENGVNLNVIDFDGQTPLHAAVNASYEAEEEEKREFYREMIQYLIQSGANPNAADLAGVVPLHQAAEIGDVVLAEILIENGAWVDIRDNEGENALFYALRGQHTEFVEMLVRDKNVDLASKNDDDETVEDYCKAVGDVEMLCVISALKNPAAVPWKPSNLPFVLGEKNFAEEKRKSVAPFSLSAGSSYGLERGQAFA